MESTPVQETNKNTDGSSSKLLPVVILGGIIIVVLFAVLIMKPGKNADQSQVAPVNQETMNKQIMTETALPSEEEVTNARVIKIEAGSFYYNPKEIRVKKGEKIQIELTSKDMMHNFVIDELNVNMPIIKSGDTGSVVFTADKVGSFQYYCSVGNHRSRGQVGTLIVEE
jgi:heme/copper-type cytochrome/quinol oxidase subunit 2